MLIELTIRNIALIESLCIEFVRGFNVLTGETGSGKSIVVDCVNLVLGGRADRDFVRTGAEKGIVQALFDVSENIGAQEVLNKLGVDWDDGMVAISRELGKNGRNICRIGGMIVPLAVLKSLTVFLMDIHGQHEHQALLNPANHVDFLDSFGGEEHRNLLHTVFSLYQRRSALVSTFRQLKEAASERERLQDILTFQVEEISSAKLKHGEEERLIAKLRLLENSQRIRDKVETAVVLTYRGDEGVVSAQESLQKAAAAMMSIASLDPAYEELSLRLSELYETTRDAGYELQDILENLQADPALMEKIEQRLSVIDRLERKYGSTVSDVIAFGEEAAHRLAMLQNSDEQIATISEQLKSLESELLKACERLSCTRKEIAEKLSTEMMDQLRDLGMDKTCFDVRIDSVSKPTAKGVDRVEFLISPNPGEPMKPIASIASGGELSRIMLALKVISMKVEGVDAMVFDEIDTGVSGKMAQVVGEKMCAIACRNQVLCVTHLPQIAALADAQYLVEKQSVQERTETSVLPLDYEGRIGELSRLVWVSGNRESSMQHAANMLQEAEKIRQTIRSRQ
ncbi:MAG: DNA repair protein RecN [Christensenellales bacterium]|nr:DNA repair protein RecN [Christensenellales bacterium]